MKQQKYYNEITPLTSKIGSKDCENGNHNEVSIKRETMTVEEYQTLPFKEVQHKWMQRVNIVWLCIYCGNKRFLKNATEEDKQVINSMSHNDLQKRLDAQDRMHYYYGLRLKEQNRIEHYEDNDITYDDPANDSYEEH